MSHIPLVLAEETVVAIVMIGGMIVAIVSIISMTVSRLVRNSQRERTRREIAAYVAEGSISSDEGERLMRAAAEEAKTS